jgi:hypothetical protein
MKITVPTSLKDITLKDYQRYLKIYMVNPDDEDLNSQKLVELMCGLKANEVRAMKQKDFAEIVTTITNAFEEKPNFKTRFTHNGVEYGFIPNLEDIPFGEYIDLNNYLQSADDLHRAMAVMYRPITLKHKETYLIEEYKSASVYANVMREVPLDICMGAQVFFYNLAKELLAHTTVFSLTQEKMEKLTTAQRQILEKNGDGISPFMHSLEEMFRDLNISLN